ncbi:hypothetical protein HY992_03055 [Candidatus Micrarchaeota archaeon]|nr:hypothetical protein [Candidatus Micrarchaeota archaeon]
MAVRQVQGVNTASTGIGFFPVRARSFSERFQESATRVFLRLKRDHGALAFSFEGEAINASIIGDHLRAARFYGASAKRYVKLKEFEKAAVRFSEHGKSLSKVAVKLSSDYHYGANPFLQLAAKRFTQAAKAFEKSAVYAQESNAWSKVYDRSKAYSSAGECYHSAAEALMCVKEHNEPLIELVPRARCLFLSAASAFEKAGNEAEKTEMLREAEKLGK